MKKRAGTPIESTDTPTLKVGDTLWWVPDRGEAGEVTVKKVGRKWATVGKPAWGVGMNERIDYLNPRMPANNGNWESHGRCYRSPEEYLLICQRVDLWIEISRFIQGTYQIPAHLDVDDLESMLQALKGGADGP